MNERVQKLLDLCRQYQIDILFAFGSRSVEVKNWFDNSLEKLENTSPDVDIGVKPGRGSSFSVEDKVQLALDLEQMLGVNWVDLISLDECDPFLAANIIRGERLFADDDYLADEYVLYVLRRAGDLAPLERERMALVLGKEE